MSKYANLACVKNDHVRRQTVPCQTVKTFTKSIEAVVFCILTIIIPLSINYHSDFKNSLNVHKTYRVSYFRTFGKRFLYTF